MISGGEEADTRSAARASVRDYRFACARMNVETNRASVLRYRGRTFLQGCSVRDGCVYRGEDWDVEFLLAFSLDMGKGFF